VTVGGQSSAPAGSTGYLPPSVLRVSGAGTVDAATAGGQQLVIDGDQFGPAGTGAAGEVTVTYGGPGAGRFTAAGCVVRVDHTQIWCVTAPGTGRGHSLLVFVGGRASAVFAAGIAYSAPTVAWYRGAGAHLADTAGGQGVVIEGRSFGRVDAAPSPLEWVVYGEKPAGEATMPNVTFPGVGCAVSKDDSEITCATAPGAGKNLVWIVSIDGQLSRVATTDYAPPEIRALSGPGAAGGSTDGGQEVVVAGANFGGPAATPGAAPFLSSVRYGPSGVEYAAACTPLSHAALRCTTAPGVGAGLRWTATVAAQTSAPSAATTDYAPPELLEISPNQTLTGGGGDMMLRGRNFGLLDGTAYVEVAFGAGGERLKLPSGVAPVKGRQAGGFDYLKITVPAGEGTGISVSVVTGSSAASAGGAEQASAPLLFSYAPPRILNIGTFEGPLPGSLKLVVDGSSFGRDGVVRVDGKPVDVAATCGPAGSARCWSHEQV
jgi:hypothetical protein